MSEHKNVWEWAAAKIAEGDGTPRSIIIQQACESHAASLRAECERLRVQLVGCGVAANGGTSAGQVAERSDYGWSPAYQDVLNLRLKYEAVFNDLTAAKSQVETLRVALEKIARYAGFSDGPMAILGTAMNAWKHLGGIANEALVSTEPPATGNENRTSLDGLRYALEIVAERRILNRPPAYLAALDEIDTFLKAAIERVEHGESMRASNVSTTSKDKP